MQLITATQLERKSNEDQCTIVDVRSGAEVRGEWLENCINIPLHELTVERFRQQVVLRGVEDTHPVYLLCAGGHRARTAAQQLADAVSNPIYVIEGGIEALKSTSLPIHQSKKAPISLERQVRITAGLLVLTGVILGVTVAPWGYAISAFVGAGLTFAGVTDTCAMGMVLARMPWNKA